MVISYRVEFHQLFVACLPNSIGTFYLCVWVLSHRLSVSMCWLLESEHRSLIQKVDGDSVVYQAVQLVGEPRAGLRVLQVQHHPQAPRHAALLPALPLQAD